MIIADEKIYIATSQHTQPIPLPRGNKLTCFNALTGEEIWHYPFNYYTTSGGISAGILFVTNSYDGYFYGFGMGETATAVTVSPSVVSKGASVLIEGAVTDQSAGAKGAAAVADEDMTAWMEYLYNNKPMPADAAGVPVLLQAMKSDYSVIDIGHATTDLKGHFEYLWAPPDEDTYKILATFEGSRAYYGSWGETGLGVTAAAEVVTPESPVDTTNLQYGILGGVVAAIVIGLAALFVGLRRK